MSESIRSYGAAMTVTGSCHLLEIGGSRILIDCGAFQGSRALFDLNRKPFGFEPREVDAVLLTHAHLDHSGRLPTLVKGGYGGRIHALPATQELCRHLLLDAAKIQHEDAERDRRRGRAPDEPTFDEGDVQTVLDRMEALAYGGTVEIAGLRVTPHPAGHIPGSAIFEIEAGDRRLVFSGDIGNARKDVLPDPTPCPEADVVVMESTYGDRDHRSYADTVAEFAAVMRDAAQRGGKVLIPSFALERTQEVLYLLARAEERHQIPPLPVYVDSPLASRVDEVYDAFPEELSDELRLIEAQGRDPFQTKHLRYTRSVEESKQITASGRPAIVIAGSGMLSGGRILHHLRAHLDEPGTTVAIVGYQPSGGLGRELVEGAESVRVMGQEVEVRARVVTINGLSAHADRTELLDWARSAGTGAEIRLVHGEPRSLEALRAALGAQGQTALVQPSEVRLPEDDRHREEAGE
ncbi:MAG: MBL fold metallo-hydrolase [Thermoleophilia bacterium]